MSTIMKVNKMQSKITQSKIRDALKEEIYKVSNSLPHFTCNKKCLGKKFKSLDHYFDFIILLCEPGDTKSIKQSAMNRLSEFFEEEYLKNVSDKTKVIHDLYAYVNKNQINTYLQKLIEENSQNTHISPKAISRADLTSKITDCPNIEVFTKYIKAPLREQVHNLAKLNQRKYPQPYKVDVTEDEVKELNGSKTSDDFKEQERKALSDLVYYAFNASFITVKEMTKIFSINALIYEMSSYDYDIFGTKIDFKCLGMESCGIIRSSFLGETPISFDTKMTEDSGSHLNFGLFIRDLLDGKEDAMLCQASMVNADKKIEYMYFLTKECIKPVDSSSAIIDDLIPYKAYVEYICKNKKVQ